MEEYRAAGQSRAEAERAARYEIQGQVMREIRKEYDATMAEIQAVEDENVRRDRMLTEIIGNDEMLLAHEWEKTESDARE
ncbi:MAG: hypothetical protein JO026_03795 [Patescibacteria group bacterium]|nr:hypothetical protein [Patescibacteria group bacterium]